LSRPHQKNFSVQGIIISRKNFFETDKIISILSKERGIIRCIVRGARKPSSKLSGSTELFVYGDFFLAKGKNLDVLTSAKPQEYFEGETNNLERVSHFFLMSESLDKLMPHEIPNEKIYNETLSFFKISEKNSENPSLVYECIYKNLITLGYGLLLDVCAKCHKKTKNLESSFLSLSAGGLLCEECAEKDDFQTRLSPQAIKLLKFIEGNNIDRYSKVQFQENIGTELAGVITDYLNYIYQREMKSPKFVKEIRQLQKNSRRSKI